MGMREVRRRARDARNAMSRGKFEEGCVAFVVVGISVTGEFDGHAVGTEPVDEIEQCCFGGEDPARGERLSQVPPTTTGEDLSVPTGGVGERVVVVPRVVLLP